MGNERRLVAFLVSFATASALYVAIFTVVFGAHGPHDLRSDLFALAFGVFFWFFNGIAAALALLSVPWYFVVRFSPRQHRLKMLYFLLCGAAITLAIGCVTSSLSPKPFFVEDQTFIEGVLIAAQRRSGEFLSTGCVFGLTFWLMSERRRPLPSRDAVKMQRRA